MLFTRLDHLLFTHSIYDNTFLFTIYDAIKPYLHSSSKTYRYATLHFFPNYPLLYSPRINYKHTKTLPPERLFCVRCSSNGFLCSSSSGMGVFIYDCEADRNWWNRCILALLSGEGRLFDDFLLFRKKKSSVSST